MKGIVQNSTYKIVIVSNFTIVYYTIKLRTQP